MKYSEFLKLDRPCPFDEPAHREKVLENETAYLTYALAPYHPDHMLVVPKRHVEHIGDLTPREHADIEELLDRAWDILRSLGHQSITHLVREGVSSGRTVEHIHYHAIPDVRIGDVDHNGDERRIMNPEEVTDEISRLRHASVHLTHLQDPA